MYRYQISISGEMPNPIKLINIWYFGYTSAYRTASVSGIRRQNSVYYYVQTGKLESKDTVPARVLMVSSKKLSFIFFLIFLLISIERKKCFLKVWKVLGNQIKSTGYIESILAYWQSKWLLDSTVESHPTWIFFNLFGTQKVTALRSKYF